MNFGKLLLLLFHDMVGLNLFLFGSKLVAAVEGRTFLHLVPGREKKKLVLRNTLCRRNKPNALLKLV